MDTLLVEGYSESVDLFRSNSQSTQKIYENYDFAQPDPNHETDPAPFPTFSSVGDNSVQLVPDFPDDMFNFISEILMEDDLDDKFASFHDYSAILATEQSLADALIEDPLDSPSIDLTIQEPQDRIDEPKARKIKIHQRDGTDSQDDSRKSKLSAAYDSDKCVEMEQYDDVFLWQEGKEDCSNGHEKPKASKGRRTKAKKQQIENEEAVDLRTLLNLCAQAISSFDFRTANELLRQIKKHSSPYGNGIQRVAHFFADGLEARMAGSGSGSHLCQNPVMENRVSCSDILKTYRTYAKAVPLRRTAYYLANQTIGKVSKDATAIHVIDFGIFFGFQWPCFIQGLSKREKGPPRLRITGIGFPERGFKPAATIEETGRRLEGYCKRFNVPFEYNSIAKKWNEITLEDIKVERDEVVVVNCMYESRSLFEETTEEDSPRDCFLKLIRRLNPDIFVHGIINGSFNAPFFMTRFKEALFHYSAIFDMLEETIGREDQERVFIERELYGKTAVNVIACEGLERLERPESYKQWRSRTRRAGFTEIELDRGLVGVVKEKVKANYHKDFVLGEDGNWMLQGWKGRILYAISCWRPA